MCSACFGRFFKFAACHPGRSVQVWKDEARHPSSGAEVAITGGEPGSWQVSGEEGRKDVQVVRGSERRTCLPPGCLFLRVVSFYPSFLLPFAPLGSHCCPETEIQALSKNQQHKPLRLKPLWLQNLLWITWELLHLSLYSLFSPINYKIWSQELEDKLVCQPQFGPTGVRVSVLIRKKKMKKQMIGSLTLWWYSVWFIGKDLPF